MAYCELQDVRSYLGISLTTDDDLLEAAIEDAQSYIESQTDRWFEAHTASRYYFRDALDADDGTLLHLDGDLLTVTTLTNGDTAGTAIVSTNYWLMDRNLGPPYHWIRLKKDTGVYWEWDTDYYVTVTGTWGYSTTPPGDIVRATIALAAYFYKQKDSQLFDTIAMPESGVITIPSGIPATTLRIIERYKRYI